MIQFHKFHVFHFSIQLFTCSVTSVLTLYFDIAHEFLLDKCDCISRNTLEMLQWDLVCRFSSVEPNQAALARE